MSYPCRPLFLSEESENAARRTGLSSNVLGVIWMMAAVSLLTGMFGIAKVLMQTMPIAEVGMFRFLTSLLFLIPWLATNGLGVLKTERPFAHFWRAFFGATSLLAGIYAVHHMLLADATVLTFTIPLWSIIMAAVFLRTDQVSSCVSDHYWFWGNSFSRPTANRH